MKSEILNDLLQKIERIVTILGMPEDRDEYALVNAVRADVNMLLTRIDEANELPPARLPISLPMLLSVLAGDLRTIHEWTVVDLLEETTRQKYEWFYRCQKLLCRICKGPTYWNVYCEATKTTLELSAPMDAHDAGIAVVSVLTTHSLTSDPKIQTGEKVNGILYPRGATPESFPAGLVEFVLPKF